MKPEEKQRELEIAQQALQTSFNYLNGKLGIADPASEFQLLDYIKDELEMRHCRLQQVYQGLPIFGNHIIVHLTKDLAVRDHTGDYRKVADLKLTPAIKAQAAIEIARTDSNAPESDDYKAELIIFPLPDSAENRLCYLVTLPFWRDELPLRLRYFIDAETSAILQKYNDQPVTGEANLARNN